VEERIENMATGEGDCETIDYWDNSRLTVHEDPSQDNYQ
jgi:hypothetical protein